MKCSRGKRFLTTALNQQWHHLQNGDHDIDSDLAWDITTGIKPLTAPRIVVAVLEGGGANYEHIDLIDNHWVNDQEIPNNGIDDDDNGFVDYDLQRVACPKQQRQHRRKRSRHIYQVV